MATLVSKLLGLFGKKFLLQVAMMVLAPLLSQAKAKWGLEIGEDTINRLIEMVMVGVAAQGVSDAVSKGATSSLGGTPSITAIKAGISPPPPSE